MRNKERLKTISTNNNSTKVKNSRTSKKLRRFSIPKILYFFSPFISLIVVGLFAWGMGDCKNPFYWLGIAISIFIALLTVKYEKWLITEHELLSALLILFMVLGFPFLMFYFTVALGHPSPGLIIGSLMTWLGVGGVFEFHKIAMKSGVYKESIRMIFSQPKKENKYLSKRMARKILSV